MRYLLKHAVQFLSAGVILLTFLSYLAPFVNPAVFRWFAFFGTAFPWLLLANVILLIVWASRFNRFALYHIGILAFGWQHITGFIGFDAGQHLAPENAITVATHNVGRLWSGGKLSDSLITQTATEYARFLKENGAPDILCTQETKGAFYRALAEKMGYAYTFNLKKGTVIYSRFPMEGGGDIPFGKTSNSSLWVDVRIGKKLVRVYNVHLQSNKVTYDTEKMLDGSDLAQEETWDEVGKVLRKVGGATSLRAEQAQRLRQHLDDCPYPVILCGDFNDTPNSYVYHLLSEGFTDTFREKGFGRGTTFGGALPMLRIDYILTDPGIHTYDCHVVRGRFSDHYPVFTQIGL